MRKNCADLILTKPKRHPVKDLRQVLRLAAKALASGGTRESPTRIKWNLAGNCDEPFVQSHVGRPSKRGSRYIDIGPGMSHTLEVELWLRCRKCRPCLMARGRKWYLAAQEEIRCSSRTWFGTLTMSPENHYLMWCRTRQRSDLRLSGIDYTGQGSQFAALARTEGKEITKFLKRVRKNSKARLRFCLCVERHTQKLEGYPHWHFLLHEKSLPVTHAVLTKAWFHGFSKFKLVDDFEEAARYVSKYLYKDAEARVRASVGYGAPARCTYHDLLGLSEQGE